MRERGLEMRNLDLRLRRHAVEIVSQLPESASDARTVLAYARQLVDEFLGDQSPSVGSRPNLRAIAVDKSPVAPSSIHPVDKPGI